LEEVSPWLLFAISALIIVGLALFALLSTRRLELIPRTRLQSFLEVLVGTMNNFVVETIGPGGEKYTPFIGTIFVFVLAMNLIGLVPGFKSPTSNLSLIIPLAVIVFVMYNYYGIRSVGALKYLKHLVGQPLWLAPLMLPIHIISELARPVSLSIRLFGNIFGEETLLVVLAGLTYVVVPYFVAIPTQFPVMLLAVLTAFVQAMVFMILTTIYISLAISPGEGEAH
jgi:F-type H+-transporting ATPase subunit a